VEIVVSDVPATVAADRIAFRLRDAVRRRGRASVAVSGGSTAPPMIDVLAATSLPWSSIGVWQVDERIAPDGDPARNAGQLAPFDSLACDVNRMPVADADLRAATWRYAAGLPTRFDVVHLGIGTDGHTASWPPDRPEVRSSPRSVELVEMFNGHPRMTLTRRVVNGARSRVVLAMGAAKRPVVERWLLEDPSLPITAVRRTSTHVFLDAPAAPVVTPR
jgi:6-phosphogluconolactonase/glucosamine-6-phosphate isomerase/deaminase